MKFNVNNYFDGLLSNNNLKKLPKNIVNLKNLKWLSLLDNKDLILEEEQKKWIQSLQNNGCKVFLEK
jgi:Leucine-rich repeat (LRR) protein